MNSSEITKVILIFLVFGILFTVNILAVGIADIKKNWPLYRCNPTIMPFASFFGHDPTSNFTYCIQNMQSAYMGSILQPINYNLNALASVGSELTGAISSARGFIARLRSAITDIVGSVFGVFLNLVIQMQKILINIKDTFGKISGIMATLLYTLSGTVLTTQSMWNGPPGQMVRALCFHPHTIVKLASGDTSRMCDIDIGDVLKNGSVVCATMKIKNYDNESKPIHNFWKLEGGEGERQIFVTGCHLVKHPKSGDFVPVSDHPDAIETTDNTKWFSCLITSDHTIPIGDHVFHDWEDNNGSPSKDLM
jgi:hypothetical protein